MSANVSILGNLGGAPETRFTTGGTFVANFSIASNTVRSSPNGKVEKTDWFRVTAFGNQAETLAKYAKKGTRLLIQGNLTTGAWLNREGVPQVSADVLLQDFQFAGGKEKEETGGGASSTDETISHRQETEISGDVQEISNQELSY
jgi:single-strand DNA-binding protein